jgi:hypothetical protein
MVMLRELYQVQWETFVRCNTHLQLLLEGVGRARAEPESRYDEGEGGTAMNKRALRFGAVALACLLASACKGRQEPVKPIASVPIAPIVCFIDY